MMLLVQSVMILVFFFSNVWKCIISSW